MFPFWEHIFLTLIISPTYKIDLSKKEIYLRNQGVMPDHVKSADIFIFSVA